jgi:Sulfotransferase domain
VGVNERAGGGATSDGDDRDADDRGLRRIAVSAFARLPPSAKRTILHALGKFAPWEDGFDPTPPRAGMRETTGPPDFVGIGVQKAGTTWWFDAICAHPDVSFRPDIHKERHFFDRYAIRSFGPGDCSRYHGWFPRPPGSLTGEWTPDYMHLAWVPPLLAQAAPRARLLVLLRDPVERFRSGLAHSRRDRGRLTTEMYQDSFARGLYHDALRRWSLSYPAHQILVQQYERCVADPEGELDRTYRFLGLDPFAFEGVQGQVNTTAHAVDLHQDIRRRLVELYTPDVTELSASFPDIDLALWPNFAHISVA